MLTHFLLSEIRILFLNTSSKTTLFVRFTRDVVGLWRQRFVIIKVNIFETVELSSNSHQVCFAAGTGIMYEMGSPRTIGRQCFSLQPALTLAPTPAPTPGPFHFLGLELLLQRAAWLLSSSLASSLLTSHPHPCKHHPALLSSFLSVIPSPTSTEIFLLCACLLVYGLSPPMRMGPLFGP